MWSRVVCGKVPPASHQGSTRFCGGCGGFEILRGLWDGRGGPELSPGSARIPQGFHKAPQRFQKCSASVVCPGKKQCGVRPRSEKPSEQ